MPQHERLLFRTGLLYWDVTNFFLRAGAHPVAYRTLGGRSGSAGLRANPPHSPQHLLIAQFLRRIAPDVNTGFLARQFADPTTGSDGGIFVGALKELPGCGDP
jgi:hypothetical protein